MASLHVEGVSSMTAVQLRTELASRGLETSGRKALLVQRLSKGLDTPVDTAVDTSVDRDREEREPSMTGDALRAAVVSVVSKTLPTILAALQPATDASTPPSLSQVGIPLLSTSSPMDSVTAPTSNGFSSSPPRKLSERILSGEFIELDELLKDGTGHFRLSAQPLQFEISDGKQLRLRDDDQIRFKSRCVHDLSTWLEAWTVYLDVVLQVAPQRTWELLAYQALIVEANRRFYPEAWIEYDKGFRRQAACNQSKHWGVIDTNLWQLCTTGRARPSCPACSMVHPSGVSGHRPFRPSHRQPLSTSQLPSVAQFDGRQVCRNFNSHCCWDSCNRANVCLQCRGKLPVSKCQTTLSGNGKPVVRNSRKNQATPRS